MILEPEAGKKFKTDAKVTIKTTGGQIIKGTINIGINSDFFQFIKEDLHQLDFIAVYNTMKMGREGHSVFVNVSKIDYITPQGESDPQNDMLLGNNIFNLVHVSVQTSGTTLAGDLNLGMNKRVSDRLREAENYLPLFNVYLDTTNNTNKSTVYINKNEIKSVFELFE